MLIQLRIIQLFTIPMFIIKQWRLKAGDKLDWSLESRKNEITIVVRMAESKKK